MPFKREQTNNAVGSHGIYYFMMGLVYLDNIYILGSQGNVNIWTKLRLNLRNMNKMKWRI